MTADPSNRNISPIDRHVGMRLKLLRELLDFSLEQLSELTDIGAVELRRFESGMLRIGAPSLYLLAARMEMPVSWFFAGLQADQAVVGSDNNALHTAAEALNYEEGLALINRCYEIASPERREMLIAVAQSIMNQQGRSVQTGTPVKPKKRNGDSKSRP